MKVVIDISEDNFDKVQMAVYYGATKDFVWQAVACGEILSDDTDDTVNVTKAK